MDVFFIYGLVDSAEPYLVRYVGQTAKPRKRLKLHYAELHSYWGASGAWKWSVLYFGRWLDMRILEIVYGTRQDALAREKWHIDDQAAKHGRLMNGNSFRWRQQQAGVPACLAESQILLLHSLRQQLRRPVSQTTRMMLKDVAHVIDHNETEFRSLLMCGTSDSFANRLPRKKLSRFHNPLIDRQAVSR